MLTIDREIVDAIVAHARRDHPEEACGVVAGPAGSDRPARHIPMDNAERSMTFYRFDPMEQLRIWRATSIPSNPGRPMSITTKSGLSSSAV